MLKYIMMIGALSTQSAAGPERWRGGRTCDSTIFGFKGDEYGGRSPTVLTGKPVTDADVGIAHRTWRMGTRVKIKNLRTGLVATGIVLDRGPYGMVDENGWFNSMLEKDRAKARILKVGRRKAYRGCADITPSFAKKLGHIGRDKIKLWRKPRKRLDREPSL